FFFFQAEDGIRDLIVTGVQTCALPICRAVCRFVVEDYAGVVADCDAAVGLLAGAAQSYELRGSAKKRLGDFEGALADFDEAIRRSEERRVGKECRSRWWT